MSQQSKSLLTRQMNLHKIRIKHHCTAFQSLRQGRYNHDAFRYLSSTNKKQDESTSPKIHVHVEKSSSPSTGAVNPTSPFASAPPDTKGGCGGNHNHSNTTSSAPKVSRRFTIPPQQQLNNRKQEGSDIDHDYLNSISPSDHLNNVTSVQSRDYENSYLPGILLSKASSSSSTKEIDIQKFYFALRAFHIEIASIRNNESNPQQKQQQGGLSSGSNLALLRMRWWKESLNYLYPEDDNAEGNEKISNKKKRSTSGNVGNNPTIRSLKHVVETQKLSRHLFETMIDARIDDLEYEGGATSLSSSSSVDNFNSMNDMIDFYSKTSSSLLLLQLESCGVKLFNEDGSDIENNENVERIKEVANCIGVGVGIMNSIRSINTGRNAIPNDLITKYNVNSTDINDPRSILNGTNDKGKVAIQSAVKEMALVAKDFLYHARLHQSNIPSGDAKITLLSVVSAVRYMERLEGLEYDIFHETLRDVEHIESLNGRLWRLGSMFYLWRAWLSGVF